MSNEGGSSCNQSLERTRQQGNRHGAWQRRGKCFLVSSGWYRLMRGERMGGSRPAQQCRSSDWHRQFSAKQGVSVMPTASIGAARPDLARLGGSPAATRRGARHRPLRSTWCAMTGQSARGSRPAGSSSKSTCIQRGSAVGEEMEGYSHRALVGCVSTFQAPNLQLTAWDAGPTRKRSCLSYDGQFARTEGITPVKSEREKLKCL